MIYGKFRKYPFKEEKKESNNGCLGCIWFFVHLFALVFFFPALFITIPLHLVALTMKK